MYIHRHDPDAALSGRCHPPSIAGARPTPRAHDLRSRPRRPAENLWHVEHGPACRHAPGDRGPMARSERHRRQQRVRETPQTRYPSTPGAAVAGVLLDSDIVIEILRGRAKTSAELRHRSPGYSPTAARSRGPKSWPGCDPGRRRSPRPSSTRAAKSSSTRRPAAAPADLSRYTKALPHGRSPVVRAVSGDECTAARTA